MGKSSCIDSPTKMSLSLVENRGNRFYVPYWAQAGSNAPCVGRSPEATWMAPALRHEQGDLSHFKAFYPSEEKAGRQVLTSRFNDNLKGLYRPTQLEMRLLVLTIKSFNGDLAYIKNNNKAYSRKN